MTQVVLVARGKAKLEVAADEIIAAGGEVLVVVGDASKVCCIRVSGEFLV